MTKKRRSTAEIDSNMVPFGERRLKSVPARLGSEEAASIHPGGPRGNASKPKRRDIRVGKAREKNHRELSGDWESRRAVISEAAAAI